MPPSPGLATSTSTAPRGGDPTVQQPPSDDSASQSWLTSPAPGHLTSLPVTVATSLKALQ
eukprot:2578244-Amphidinium_carterae.1